MKLIDGLNLTNKKNKEDDNINPCKEITLGNGLQHPTGLGNYIFSEDDIQTFIDATRYTEENTTNVTDEEEVKEAIRAVMRKWL